jgi:hypothetical protein
MLCDDNSLTSLYELKRSLTIQISNFRVSNIKYELFLDLQEQDLNHSLSTNKTNSIRENYVDHEIKTKKIKLKECAFKIRELEASIKELEPNFKLPIDLNSRTEKNKKKRDYCLFLEETASFLINIQ